MKTIWISIVLIIFSVACKESKEETKPKTDQTSAHQNNSPDLTKFGIDTASVPRGIDVGSQAPNLVIKTELNEELAFHNLYQKQPLVVIFYRGYWCPSCNRYLSNFAKRAIEIEKAGAKIVAVTPETYENTQKTKDSTGLDFMVVSDLDGSIMQAFDVQFDVTSDYDAMIFEHLDASISASNASQKSVLPVPATYIINTNGEIVYKQFNPDYNQRASIDEILKHLPSNTN